MNAVLRAALEHWSFDAPSVALIAARENAVYRVDSGNTRFALRLHRKGYRTDAELRSELQWMDAMADGGISVPAPIAARDGDFLQVIADVQIDVLTWLKGSPLSSVIDELDATKRTDVFTSLGRTMARLHDLSDVWQAPEGFTRCAWDRAGLLGETPLWDRFWMNPELTEEDQRLFIGMRQKADDELAAIEKSLDHGLIHADLVAANVMVDGDVLHLIDFDDGGFGFRIFDLATALLKFIDAPDYRALKSALLIGYQSERAMDLHALDLFLLLRAVTYVGWNISRMAEDGGAERNARFIATARRLALDYVQG